jgi:transposase-like protein
MGCGSADVARIKSRNKWRCRDCNRQFTAKVGTVFEDSPIGFDKWLPAMWLLSANRNGISSCELGRGLGVCQKTAWFILHRLRHAMQTETFDKLQGEVEADEAYIGGHFQSMNQRRRRAVEKSGKTAYSAKAPVFGIVERKGRVRAWAVPDLSHKSLLPKIINCVDQDATLYTDTSKLYTDINYYVLHHESVNHMLHEYVRGNAHVNNIEAFWAVLKRTIGGTYTHVNPRHLDRYLAEQVYRFNEREEKDGYRFRKATKGVDGKRLTYKALIAKE